MGELTWPQRQMRWLVTGAAGFIGSHLVEDLLAAGQEVVALDNFSSGTFDLGTFGRTGSGNLTVIRGDIRNGATCRDACEGVDYILHHAAIASVPDSIADPVTAHEVNVSGTVNLFEAARAAGVRRSVYASSSAVYGDDPEFPKREACRIKPLSPYAAGKAACELYAEVYSSLFQLPTIGLRYFNVFGPRQVVRTGYGAVIPQWIGALLRDEVITINGDGETTRDFCYVKDVVQANVRAAFAPLSNGSPRVFNVAAGQQVSLNALAEILRGLAARHRGIAAVELPRPRHGDERPGDVRHSAADLAQAGEWLGYQPAWSLEEGLRAAFPWYAQLELNESRPAKCR